MPCARNWMIFREIELGGEAMPFEKKTNVRRTVAGAGFAPPVWLVSGPRILTVGLVFAVVVVLLKFAH